MDFFLIICLIRQEKIKRKFLTIMDLSYLFSIFTEQDILSLMP